jgi:hypothetical protein
MNRAAARILVATDLGDQAAEALAQAHVQAQSVDGALGVCHVLPGPGVEMLFPQRYVKEAAEAASMDQRARSLIGERVIATTGRAPISFEVFVEHGTVSGLSDPGDPVDLRKVCDLGGGDYERSRSRAEMDEGRELLPPDLLCRARARRRAHLRAGRGVRQEVGARRGRGRPRSPTLPLRALRFASVDLPHVRPR